MACLLVARGPVVAGLAFFVAFTTAKAVSAETTGAFGALVFFVAAVAFFVVAVLVVVVLFFMVVLFSGVPLGYTTTFARFVERLQVNS